jgi:anaphase-promoting complex subunit 10
MIDDASENETNEHNYMLLKVGVQETPLSDSYKREIGEYGIWSLSSSKQGNSIEQLRDDNINTFWQSDGIQPHFILIQFLKKFRINEIWIYLDYKTDESYTPSRISIQIENSFNEMTEIKLVDFEEPSGWFRINLEERNSKGEIFKPYIKTMQIKINILQNTHNGRDTHVRCLKIFSPREHKSFDFGNPKFINSEYTQYQTIR